MPKPTGMKLGSPDDFQTIDAGAIKCLAPYLPKDIIWEPACGEGFLVQHLIDHGFDVIGTDIKKGHDFLNQNVQVSRCIVTNPPFSIKERFLSRCYEIGKPFALLMPLTTFDSAERRSLMDRNGILIMPPKRYSFETPTQTAARKANKSLKKKSSAWFYSCWFTNGLNIGKQITFTDSQRFI